MINSTDQLDMVFQALSDGTRRDILQRLRTSKELLTVNEIAGIYDISLPAISRHLKVLEEAGLVLRQRHGREHHISLNLPSLKYSSTWLSRMSSNPHENFLADLSR